MRIAIALSAAAALLAACGGNDPLPQEVPNPGASLQRPANPNCVAPELAPSGSAEFSLAAAFPELPALSALVYLLLSPDGTQWYALQQRGELVRFANDPAADSLQPVIDLTPRLSTGNEEGLLGLDFHPDFANQRFAYVYYSATGPRRSVISRLAVNPDGSFDAASELVLLEVPQFASNHNGGTIAFGPDGFLYIGLGDGGGANDPQEHGENTNTLLGSMLRIDVDNPSGGRNYGIPADNPFADGNGGLPEIYAYGLRNPYRWSFDPFTGELWAADVGQNAYEEVDIITRGGNYGWNTMEGFHCFDPAQGCVVGDRVLPVAEYPHSAGRSVTGGQVYRGSAIPGLRGRYVFGDFTNGNLWAITRDAGPIDQSDVALDSALSISAFARDSDGELLVLNYFGGPGGGIHRLVPADGGGAASNTVSDTLSGTGCVRMDNPRLPADGTVAYAPNAPFWSDGATKYRAAALPDGTTVQIDPDGDLLLPTGAVLIKHFELDDEIFETRLFYHHADGWQGYSYRWNAERSEAFLLTDSLDEPIAGQTWHYPSPSECGGCHTQAANVSLGPETGQLNGDFAYPGLGVSGNQLDTLEAIDWLARPLNAGDFDDPLPDPNTVVGNDLAAAQNHAKAYLHTNCAMCHRPTGPTNSGMDLRFSTPLAQMGVCGVQGNAGNALLTPGDTAQSELRQRMASTGDDQMPPIARNVVDNQGLAVIDHWINQLTACP